MNPRERFLTTLQGGRPDRVPLELEGFHFETPEALASHYDPGRQEIAERVYDDLVQYVTVPSHVNRYLVTPPQRMRVVDERTEGKAVVTTTEIDTPQGPLTAITARDDVTDTQWTVKYPVETPEEIEMLRSVPWELPEALCPPSEDDLADDFARRGIVTTRISSPFVCAAGMMPFEMFLELCAVDLPLVRELTEQCLERSMDVLEVLLQGGLMEYVWIGGCEWLTPPMASPRLYAELVQPYEAALIERAHDAGAFCHIHCHGNVRDTLGMVVERGGDLVEPMEPPPDGDITMAEAKAMVDGAIVLGGNMEARIVENEDLATVEAAARAAFAGGKEHMLFQTTAGPLGHMSPQTVANYHRMIDVWEDLSPFS